MKNLNCKSWNLRSFSPPPSSRLPAPCPVAALSPLPVKVSVLLHSSKVMRIRFHLHLRTRLFLVFLDFQIWAQRKWRFCSLKFLLCAFFPQLRLVFSSISSTGTKYLSILSFLLFLLCAFVLSFCLFGYFRFTFKFNLVAFHMIRLLIFVRCTV